MLPELHLTKKEFDALPEYSCSIPTGIVVGKRWKRKNDYADVSKGWMLGEYYDIGSRTDIGIKWYKPVVAQFQRTLF